MQRHDNGADGCRGDLAQALPRPVVEQISDWREPNVIRVAPVPLYNSYEDVFRFGEILKKLL